MTLTPDQVLAANKANLETLAGLTTQAFAGVEQIIALNMSAAKSALGDAQHRVLDVGARRTRVAVAASANVPAFG